MFWYRDEANFNQGPPLVKCLRAVFGGYLSGLMEQHIIGGGVGMF